MLSGANITPDRASLDAFKKALDYAKTQKVQALINGHPGLFGDEIGWMEQVRANPSGPNPFVLTARRVREVRRHHEGLRGSAPGGDGLQRDEFRDRSGSAGSTSS